MFIDSAALTDSGSAFQAEGPPTAKERSPNLLLVAGITKSSREAERRLYRRWIVDFMIQLLAMYAGANPCRDL